jgi:hypothetical protein
MIGVDLFPLQASSLWPVFMWLSIHFIKISFELSVFMKTVVMSFPCFMNILLVMKTIFVLKLLLWKKSFSMKI